MEHNCYTLACSDTGLNCDYVAKGHTMDEMMDDAYKHTKEVHGVSEYSDDEMKVIKEAIKYDPEC